MASCKKRKRESENCILHMPGIEHGPFTLLSNVKGSPADKLAYLHAIRSKRLQEHYDSPYRMQDVCDLIPFDLEHADSETIGYHRGCYQRFTMNLHRMTSNTGTSRVASASRSPRKRSSLSSTPIFPPECIFCGKLEIKVKSKTQRPTMVTSWKGKPPAWRNIESQALELGDMHLYRQVQGKDLFAAEAKFHQFCRNIFTTKYRNHVRDEAQKEKRALSTEQDRKAAAQKEALTSVLDHIEEHVIKLNEVLLLSHLRSLYMSELDRIGYPNPQYRGEKLKICLQKHEISEHIAFAKVNPGDKGFVTYNLVYSKKTTVADAVAFAFQLGSKHKHEDVALHLRSVIRRAFKESKGFPWPPSADDLSSSVDNICPEPLVQFLNLVLSGDTEAGDKSGKTRCIVQSIGQDICRAVTNGEWKLPKHILLSTTVRHLYRSRMLTTILNKLGHCESYDFSLELETAMVKAIDECSTFLTPNILTGEANEVFHLEWDNLNKITTNVHGSNVVNSTGGIMIQEVKPGLVTKHERILPTHSRSKMRSLQVDTPPTLVPVHIHNKVGPKFPAGAVFIPPAENEQVYLSSLTHHRLWLLARVVGSSARKQLVPGFGGFVSATGIKPAQKSTIEFFTPIHAPFTEYAVIQEVLERSEQATKEVGQKYVLNTFDLGGCMKALPLIWKYPQKYKNHVITIGAFHTAMNYLGMVTAHKCKGSGYAEIIVEAGLVTSGCLKSVLRGKAYDKAIFCLSTYCEAMERLLMETFMEEESIQINSQVALLNLVQSCTRENLNFALQDDSTLTIISKYIEYEGKVHAGHLGKTARFILSIIEHNRLLQMLLYSVKTNNFELFHTCNGKMADLFFAYDGQNYSRYLTWQEMFLTNIELFHPGAKELLKKGGIAVARSLIPGALSAVDKTMEETFMKFAKSAGGFVGLYSMFGAYQRWCRTTSTRAQYYEKLLDMCGLIHDTDCPKAGKHRELERAEITKREEAVQRTITTILSFTNPFTIIDKERLYNLSSGAPISQEVEADILEAEVVGKAAKEAFIRDRFQTGLSESRFFEPVKRNNLKTMETCHKTVKLTSSEGKLIRFREQSNLALMLLIKSQRLDNPLKLDELVRYALFPVPPSLGTPDGFLAKTNKASMLHFLLSETEEEVPYPKESVHIQDGNALFHVLTNLPNTFGDICLQVLDQMVHKQDFIFSTDSYHTDSIKAQERLRRGCSEKYIIDGPATRKPTDFKLFLSNEENKQQLSQLLLRVWQGKASASRLEKCGTAIVIVDGKAYKLDSSDGQVTVSEVHELMSDQEETDTRIVLYLHYIAKKGYKSAIVRTPDTDIFFILLHHAHAIPLTIFLDIGSGKHRQLINLSEFAESKGDEYCSTLLGLYVFTGEDVTSAFVGKGKVTPLKKLQGNPKYHKSFRKLGDEWVITEDVMKDIEAFTCLMYGYAREVSVDKVRSIMLKKMVGDDEQLTMKSKVDLARLPPCKRNLIPHVQRVNHRLANYKRANQATFWRPKPSDEGQGWEKNENGVLEPLWSCGPVLPTCLTDLIETVEEEETMEEEAEEFDYDDLMFSDDD